MLRIRSRAGPGGCVRHCTEPGKKAVETGRLRVYIAPRVRLIIKEVINV